MNKVRAGIVACESQGMWTLSPGWEVSVLCAVRGVTRKWDKLGVKISCIFKFIY